MPNGKTSVQAFFQPVNHKTQSFEKLTSINRIRLYVIGKDNLGGGLIK